MRCQFNLYDIVNSQKQASAFPPNFIHSLDATHMLLTALECRVRFLFFVCCGAGRGVTCLPLVVTDTRLDLCLGS